MAPVRAPGDVSSVGPCQKGRPLSLRGACAEQARSPGVVGPTLRRIPPLSSTPANPSNANPTAGTPAAAVSCAGANGCAAKAKPKKPQGPKPCAEILSRVLKPSTLGMVIPLTAAFVVLFWTWIRTQVHYGITSGDWSTPSSFPPSAAACSGPTSPGSNASAAWSSGPASSPSSWASGPISSSSSASPITWARA